MLCFNNISNGFFEARYGFTQIEAARITSTVYFIGVFLVPIFGIITDKIGHKVTYLITATTTLAVCHFLFMIIPSSTPDNVSYKGLIPIILMGLGYSLYVSAIWPMIPVVVKPNALGSAYGICYSILNTGFAILSTMVGEFTIKSKGPEEYKWVNVLLGTS